MARKNVRLTVEQRVVLQAIYDRLRETGDWPSFGVLDRQLRRDHGVDPSAVIQSIPDTLVLRWRVDRLRPLHMAMMVCRIGLSLTLLRRL